LQLKAIEPDETSELRAPFSSDLLSLTEKFAFQSAKTPKRSTTVPPAKPLDKKKLIQKQKKTPVKKKPKTSSKKDKLFETNRDQCNLSEMLKKQ
jgi:hypothetical protein